MVVVAVELVELVVVVEAALVVVVVVAAMTTRGSRCPSPRPLPCTACPLQTAPVSTRTSNSFRKTSAGAWVWWVGGL